MQDELIKIILSFAFCFPSASKGLTSSIDELIARKMSENQIMGPIIHSETARLTYALTQQFLTMLRLRRGQEFETWLEAVEASQIAELRRFAHSLCLDKDAVVAGLILSVSNGPVEAQVQKLKLVKRPMYDSTLAI